MLANDDIAVTANAKIIAMEVLRRERDRPNFGNGGAVRNLISRAQVSYGNRMRSLANENKNSDVGAPLGSEETHRVVLEPQDFDPEYERRLLNKDFGFLLNTLVGFENIINFFENYQRMAINMRGHGFDPREEIPFSFVFKGPPGTGKTTIARRLGSIYHSMGFLSTNDVLECSITGLIGPGPCLIGKNVQNLLDRALGKVLFIDEAYRLGQTDMTGAVISNFAIEALGELVDCMTKRRYAHKLVVVLAGYENDMNDLMEMNEGLRSLFTEVPFLSINPKECLDLLQMKLMEKKIRILQPKKGCEQQTAIRLFKKLSKTEAWADARDVETITKRVIRRVFSKEIPVGEELKISSEEVVAILKAFLRERNYQGHVDTSSDEENALVEAF